MLKDMKGNEVKVGDILYDGPSDFILIYKVNENGVPVTYASWTCGSLGLIERRDVGEVNKLELVGENFKEFVDQLEEKVHMALEGTIKYPMGFDEMSDEQIEEYDEDPDMYVKKFYNLDEDYDLYGEYEF